MASTKEKLHSSYYSGLNDKAKKHYAEKIKLICDIDLYYGMESKGKNTVSTTIE